MTTPCICPICSGTGRQAIGSTQAYIRRYKMSGYDPETDTMTCQNCGGQTMAGQATGQSRLRPDGTPCIHAFTRQRRGQSYIVHTCAHCGYSYDIDSSD